MLSDRSDFFLQLASYCASPLFVFNDRGREFNTGIQEIQISMGHLISTQVIGIVCGCGARLEERRSRSGDYATAATVEKLASGDDLAPNCKIEVVSKDNRNGFLLGGVERGSE